MRVLCLALVLVPAAAGQAEPAVPAARDIHFGIAASSLNVPATLQLQAGWDRVVLPWQELQPNGPNDWNAAYFPDALLQQEQQAGVEVVGLIQDTPAWARRDPSAGPASVPRGLTLAWNDPGNTWGQFINRIVTRYRGRIKHWIIWNEPEFRPNDQGGKYVTFAGGDADYYRLLKVGYQAAKAADPQVNIVLGATSYWIDRTSGRRQFLDRLLDLADDDPEAGPAGGFFDVAALNLYWSTDDIRRVGAEYHASLQAHGYGDKPLWLTETNAMPYDDPITPKPFDGQRVTREQQAAFLIQAYATALASGYERIAWNAMVDGDTSGEIWGLLRNDGTPRAAFQSYQAATTWLSGAQSATWAPLQRTQPRFGPEYGTAQIGRVVLNRPWDASVSQWVSVLWSTDGQPLTVAVPKVGNRGKVVDKYGNVSDLDTYGTKDDGNPAAWLLTLPPATAHAAADPAGYYFIGGDPLLLVEDEVPADAPIGDLAVV
jgi:hypothetical protein